MREGWNRALNRNLRDQGVRSRVSCVEITGWQIIFVPCKVIRRFMVWDLLLIELLTMMAAGAMCTDVTNNNEKVTLDAHQSCWKVANLFSRVMHYNVEMLLLCFLP